MLIGIDPLLTPELLKILQEMGHGDEIVIADCNFPARSNAKRLVRLDGVDASSVLRAVLSVMPLDSFMKAPVNGMQVVGKPKEIPPALADYQSIVDRLSPFPTKIARIERMGFYERAKACFAVIATSDRRLYGNLILTKGVIGPDGKVVVA